MENLRVVNISDHVGGVGFDFVYFFICLFGGLGFCLSCGR